MHTSRHQLRTGDPRSAHVVRLRGLFREDETTAPHRRSFVYVSNSAIVTNTVIFQGYSIDREAETVAFAGAAPSASPDLPGCHARDRHQRSVVAVALIAAVAAFTLKEEKNI